MIADTQNQNPSAVPSREMIWVMAWCAVANAINCPDESEAAQWADAALKRFDERFGDKSNVV